MDSREQVGRDGEVRVGTEHSTDEPASSPVSCPPLWLQCPHRHQHTTATAVPFLNHYTDAKLFHRHCCGITCQLYKSIAGISSPFLRKGKWGFQRISGFPTCTQECNLLEVNLETISSAFQSKFGSTPPCSRLSVQPVDGPLGQ